MRHLLLAVMVVAMVGLGPTVSGEKTQFCIGALHAQALLAEAAQQSPGAKDPNYMPPEGNPNHEQPGEKAYCDHSRVPAHTCACHNQCVQGPDGKVTQQEDGAHCRAYCYKKHCHCPWDNCE